MYVKHRKGYLNLETLSMLICCLSPVTRMFLLLLKTRKWEISGGLKIAVVPVS